MKLLLLLMLVAWLPGAAFAAPPRPGPYVPGDLAKDRLQNFAELLDAPERLLLVQPDQSKKVFSEAKAKTVAALVRDLVLDDALYTEDCPQGVGRGTEIVTLEKGNSSSLTIALNWGYPSLSVYQWYGGKSVTANYLPVLPKVLRLLQALDPGDPSLSTFHPWPIPAIAAAEGIPASVLARIATVKPGMTRAYVLHVFTTEGGLSTTYWNHYVYRDFGFSEVGHRDGLVAVNGQLVKVNVDFAPRDADIVWRNGRGFWLHQEDYAKHHKTADFNGQPDDVILRVSPPYLQHMVLD